VRRTLPDQYRYYFKNLRSHFLKLKFLIQRRFPMFGCQKAAPQISDVDADPDPLGFGCSGSGSMAMLIRIQEYGN
jgi:hypothetical protein